MRTPIMMSNFVFVFYLFYSVWINVISQVWKIGMESCYSIAPYSWVCNADLMLLEGINILENSGIISGQQIQIVFCVCMWEINGSNIFCLFVLYKLLQWSFSNCLFLQNNLNILWNKQSAYDRLLKEGNRTSSEKKGNGRMSRPLIVPIFR